MLNTILNIDLHIHSKASEYKEPKGLVEECTLENLPVLFGKLNEKDVNLISFTDHNRFDNNLYDRAIEIIESKEYPSVKGILSGVEFDVLLENDMKPCHIITIFDTKSKIDRLKIEEVIKKNILLNKNDYYTKEEYEAILKEIALNTILIVHQKQSLDNFDKSHKSLSGSTVDPYSFIKLGYISALEFNTNRVEGVLINNLRNLRNEIALFTGSDCHQWKEYPKHNINAKYEIEKYTTIKALPTFKGLLLSITSLNTRINQKEKNSNNSYINKFILGDKEFFLDKGINVIVGENGAGKSTLFNLLSSNKNHTYINKIKKDSNFKVGSAIKESKILRVKQSEIVEKYNTKSLFNQELFHDLNHTEFENEYKSYAKKIKQTIERNIKYNESLESLDQVKVTLNPNHEIKTFYINVSSYKLELTELEGITSRKNSLKSILQNIKAEYDNQFYSKEQKRLILEAHNKLKILYYDVIKEYYTEFNNNNIKNNIMSSLKEYDTLIKANQTSLDSTISEYNKDKESVLDSVVMCVKNKFLSENNTDEKLIEKIECKTLNPVNGFIFHKVSNYSGADVMDQFYKTMFVGKYNSYDKIKKIKTMDEFVEAVKGCTNASAITAKYEDNLKEFLILQKAESVFVTDSSEMVSEGRTLGQISLTYYKYHLTVDTSTDVICIDQPEDNLSNYHINDKLIKYLNGLRSSKQLIIVTHNPLLVVNLDVDNVIKVDMINGTLKCKSGCLEDEENQILQYIEANMDGGKDSIQKRYKLYE